MSQATTELSLPPKTTVQEDITTAGQRRINMIWECTQSVIAIMVILANMVVGTYQGLVLGDKRPEYPIILSSSLFLVVGFYFSRTNHAAIGGIGLKPAEAYIGRMLIIGIPMAVYFYIISHAAAVNL